MLWLWDFLVRALRVLAALAAWALLAGGVVYGTVLLLRLLLG